MNYKFLSMLALVLCMSTGVKANNLPNFVDKPQSTLSNLKFGYVDVGYILENLPEAKKNNTEIQSFHKQLDNQIQAKFKEYQEKVEVYREQLNTLTDVQRKQKEAELQKLAIDCQGLEEQRSSKMAEKYKAVMQPLHDKIQEVINKIAVEYAYTFVFNKNTDAGPVVLFAEKSFDLSELVLEKLKVIFPKEVQPPVIGKVQLSDKSSNNKAVAVKKK